jgi:hypothetical protein
MMSGELTINFDGRIYRNRDLEQSIMQRSQVDLLLRNAAHERNLDKYLMVRKDQKNNLIFCNGHIMLKPEQPYRAQLAPDNVPANILLTHGNAPAFSLNPQPACQPIIYQNWKKRGAVIVNNNPFLSIKLVMLRMAQIDNFISGVNAPIEAWSYGDRRLGAYLGGQHDITGLWGASTDKLNGAWKKATINDWPVVDFGTRCIDVFDSEEILSYKIQLAFGADGSYVILPTAYFQNPVYSEPLLVYAPPKTPYTLLNSHFLRHFPGAEVVITDNVLCALNTPPSENLIVMANIGGDAWIDELDVAFLRGRKVKLLFAESSSCAENQCSYNSIVKVAGKLYSFGITSEVATISCGGVYGG